MTYAKDTNSEVFLLLKHPASIEEPELKNQVYTFIEETLPAYFGTYEGLHVRFYSYQATLNGIKVGQSHIGVGWYTFHDENGFPRKVNDDLNPTLVYPRENVGNFEVVDEWFKDVFTEIWLGSDSLADMYESGDPQQLVEWVDQSNSEEKRELIARHSDGHPEERAELFLDH